jgi:hypothetical protein
MGGEQAIGALANDPGLRAVVAEGATNRVSGDDRTPRRGCSLGAAAGAVDRGRRGG